MDVLTDAIRGQDILRLGCGWIGTAQPVDRLGIQVLRAPASVRCCGAVDYHLDAQARGLQHARTNIDAWWPAIESGCEAILQTASGCGAFVKEYGHLLEADPAYAAKAKKVSQLALDLVELLRREPLERLAEHADSMVAEHARWALEQLDHEMEGRVGHSGKLEAV